MQGKEKDVLKQARELFCLREPLILDLCQNEP